MKALVVSLAIGVAALCGVSQANASQARYQPSAPIASHESGAAVATDVSSRRFWRHRHWGHPHWAWRHRWGYRPGFRRYGFYPGYRSYGYYRPGPVIRFGFGPRWGWHHRFHRW